MKKIYRAVLCMMFVVILLTKSVFAYIDPAATSYLVQIIAGVVIVSGAAIGIYFHKVKRLFRKDKTPVEDDVKEDVEDDNLAD